MIKVLNICAAVTMVASSAVVAGDAAKGEKGFNKCKSCHMIVDDGGDTIVKGGKTCLLYTSPSPRDGLLSRMPSSA